MITTTVGNYPKVAEGSYSTQLIGALSKWQRQELSDSQLEETYRTLTQAVIQEQEEAGLDIVTDGQIRWEDLVTPIAKRLEGFEINGLSRWFNNNVYYRRPILHKAPIWKSPILTEPYRFAAGCATKPVKETLPAPYTFAIVSEDRFYKKLRPFTLKMAEILNEEAKALAKAGAPLIQFDDPALTFAPSPANRKLAIEALRIATAGVKAKTALYTYFGPLNGALEEILRAPVDLIGLDAASNPKLLSMLKRTKTSKEIALGCLDARNTKLEPIEALHRFFDAAKKIVPLDRLTVNPSCGLEFLPHTQALAKIRRLVEAVRSYR